MLKDYYYTDKEELDALRVENVKLRQELNKAVDEIADLKAKLAKNQKRGGIKMSTKETIKSILLEYEKAKTEGNITEQCLTADELVDLLWVNIFE